MNYFGFNRADLAYKLIHYLRYGNVRTGVGSAGSRNYGTSVPVSDSSYSQNRAFNHALSVFPVLAYKKFCQDYFRLTQWQESSPYLGILIIMTVRVLLLSFRIIYLFC